MSTEELFRPITADSDSAAAITIEDIQLTCEEYLKYLRAYPAEAENKLLQSTFAHALFGADANFDLVAQKLPQYIPIIGNFRCLCNKTYDLLWDSCRKQCVMHHMIPAIDIGDIDNYIIRQPKRIATSADIGTYRYHIRIALIYYLIRELPFYNHMKTFNANNLRGAEIKFAEYSRDVINMGAPDVFADYIIACSVLGGWHGMANYAANIPFRISADVNLMCELIRHLALRIAKYTCSDAKFLCPYIVRSYYYNLMWQLHGMSKILNSQKVMCELANLHHAIIMAQT
jgi:hypothetical protein